HGPLENKNEFGKKPVGTGPYRVLEISSNGSVLLEQRDAYPQGSAFKTAGNVKRFHAIPIPDPGARIAELMVGNIDVARDIPPNQAESLDKRDQFDVSLSNSGDIYYIRFDMTGKAGNKALADERVRRAILH